VARAKIRNNPIISSIIDIVYSPRKSLWIYLLLSFLIILFLLNLYFLRFYLNPLTIRISRNPESLLKTPLELLPQADHLLIKTGRKNAVLSAADINTETFGSAISFLSDTDTDNMAAQLIHRIGKQTEGI